MTAQSLRVLVVDDSAFARKVLRECLSTLAHVEVVGIARDGLEALEKVAELRPDVMTLDLMMPHLDGLGVLEALRDKPGPKVVVVSSAEDSSERVLRALELGAVDFVHKPTALATDRLFEICHELKEKVRMCAGATPAPSLAAIPRKVLPSPPAKLKVPSTVLVLGTSTGGPQALTRLIPALPADFPAPVAVVLHIPVGYTEALAKRLDGLSSLEVREAEDGMAFVAGRVVLARAGWHLKMDGRGNQCFARLDREPSDSPHRPSVDALFRSAAQTWGPDVVGAVLTGMGNDGRDGARAIREAGGRVVTEDASTCVIYGMPRSVDEAGLSNASARLDDMAALLMELTRQRHPLFEPSS